MRGFYGDDQCKTRRCRSRTGITDLNAELMVKVASTTCWVQHNAAPCPVQHVFAKER